MSEHWTVYCVTCQEYGPDIRRSGSVTLVGLMPRYHPGLSGGTETMATGQAASDAWRAFLWRHGYHELQLQHE